MKLSKTTGSILSGAAAGAVNGMFGAGGGMVLIPLLSSLVGIEDEDLFPTSVAIILPVSLVSLSVTALRTTLPWAEALPYLIGSAAGGILTGFFGQKIPTKWLHRALGSLILLGGIRYLC
ncbi:MAG: sulfite exporter TauE/SafE family protein [Oscillospiraceae bacterium]|nr:sulfite exporter TauE/SafE family protein [Oscillospiraceae bacterium]